jgi:hypothetical protein
MNGVDAHDQLRLQRYSVQRSLCVKKYYKSLFFGLLDMALVNAYIVHTRYCAEARQKALSHAQFRTVLHEQLLSLTENDFSCNPTPTSSPSSSSPRFGRISVTNHRLQISNEKDETGRRRCKVCSLLRAESGKSIRKTRTYCVDCSSERVQVYLCDRIRNSEDNQLTCFQIWHQQFQNGRNREGTKSIRMRSTKARSQDTGASGSTIQNSSDSEAQ